MQKQPPLSSVEYHLALYSWVYAFLFFVYFVLCLFTVQPVMFLAHLLLIVIAIYLLLIYVLGRSYIYELLFILLAVQFLIELAAIIIRLCIWAFFCGSHNGCIEVTLLYIVCIWFELIVIVILAQTFIVAISAYQINRALLQGTHS